jgi:hypothetical protein
MPDFKKMTADALRELARKALGPGHARLKTKKELVEALQAAEKRLAGAAGKALRKVGAKVAAAKGRGARAAKKPAGKAAGAAGKAGRAAAKAKPAARGKGASGRAKARAGGLDPDGYFVARVRGEEAVRQAPHPMTEAAAEEGRQPEPARAGGWDEGLGDLPWSYGDDVLLALPRDPHTLFLYWDHAQETVAQAFAGLEGGRAQIWVFARNAEGGYDRLRALDFALESRGFYVHDLEPGRVYRAEIHVVDRGGRERLLPRPSNEVKLPPLGPSPFVDDRFARIPWHLPLASWLREFFPGGPFSEEARALLARLSDWSRFSGRFWGGSAGGMGGRPFSPSEGPSSPSSPWGRGGREGE